MQGWTETTYCRHCGPGVECSDEGHTRRVGLWELRSDSGERLASVQDFGYAMYGTTIWGRTGGFIASPDALERAQAACVRMFERGSEN